MAAVLATYGPWWLCAVLVKATLLLAVTFLVAWLIRHRSAATRHLVWLACVAGLLAVPILDAALPKWRILPAGVALRGDDSGPSAGTPDELDSAVSSLRVLDDASPGLASSTEEPTAAAQIRSGEGRDPLVAPSGSLLAPSTNRAGPSKAAGHQRLLLLLSCAWAAGFLAVVGVTTMGLIKLRRLVLQAASIDSGRVLQLLERVRGEMGIRSRLLAYQTHDCSMPLIYGVMRPCLVLPSQADQWPDSMILSVVRHELGHVRRGDLPVQLVVQLVCACYWFHPLVWLVRRQVIRTREGACDDLAICKGGDAVAYAGDFLSVVSGQGSSASRVLASVSMAGYADIGSRLQTILDPAVPRMSPRRSTIVAVGALFATVTFLLAMADHAAAVDQEPESPPAAAVISPSNAPDEKLVIRRLGGGGFFEHEANIRSFAISADGKTMTTLTNNGRLWVWEVDSGRRLAVIEAPIKDLLLDAIAVSADGSMLAAAGYSWGIVVVWSLEDQTVLAQFEGFNDEDSPAPGRRGPLRFLPRTIY